MTEELEPRLAFTPRSDTLDQRWRSEDSEGYLAPLKRFAAEAEFYAFFNLHQPLYETAVMRMWDVLDEHASLGWFDWFFGVLPAARFHAILGTLNGGACYGARL